MNPVSTECCGKAKEHKSVFLGYPYKTSDGRRAGIDTPYKDIKPSWFVYSYNEFNELSKTEASYCPFCNTPVPEIELSNDFRKVHDSSDGNYCDTCNKRNNECNCLPPQYRWKIKK